MPLPLPSHGKTFETKKKKVSLRMIDKVKYITTSQAWMDPDVWMESEKTLQ